MVGKAIGFALNSQPLYLLSYPGFFAEWTCLDG